MRSQNRRKCIVGFLLGSFILIYLSQAVIISRSLKATQTNENPTKNGQIIHPIIENRPDDNPKENDFSSFSFSLAITFSNSDIINSTQFRNFGVALLLFISIPLFINAIGKYRQNSDENKQHPMRELLFALIELNPGLYYRELCRITQRSAGVIQYHLKYLEEIDESIIGIEDGRYRRYFIKNYILNQQLPLDMILIINDPTIKLILRELQNSDEPLSRTILAEKIQITKQAISWQCNRLMKLNLIEDQMIAREKYYKLSPEMQNTLEKLLPMKQIPAEIS